MPGFLFIDTSATVATVALGNHDQILAATYSSDRMQQAAMLNLMIDQVLSQAGWRLEAIDCYCVCAGPGSYTGLRVGMSTAKGMAFALGKPMICFDRMQLIMQRYEAEASRETGRGVLLSARKGEYFWALFDGEGKEVDTPKHLYEADLKEKIQPDMLLLTDVPHLSFQNRTILLPEDFTPDLDRWLAAARKRWEQRDYSDLAYAEPFYLKAAFTTTPKIR